MPIYEYKGQTYEMATTDRAEAKARILKYLGESAAPAPTDAPAQPTEETPGVVDPMGGMLPSAIAAAPVRKPQSVLEGKQMPGPLPTEDQAVVNPKFVEALKRNLDAMPPEQRQAKLDEMLQRPDVYGRAAKAIAGRYAAQDKTVSPTLKKATDTRVEAITEKLIGENMEAKAAFNDAQKQALQGIIEGPQAQLTEAPAEYTEAEQYRLRRGMTPGEETAQYLKRMGVKTGAAVERGYRGLNLFVGDALGMDQRENVARLKSLATTEKALGEPPSKPMAFIEDAVASIGQQMPGMLFGLATGSEAAVLSAMFVNSFGQNYEEGRRKKLDAPDATARAAMNAALEVIGERFGLKQNMAALKASARGVPISDLAAFYGKALARDIPGEELTYAGQLAVDRGYGMRPEVTLEEFLKGAATTALATVTQAGIMMGGASAISKGAQQLQKTMQPARPGYERDTSYEGLSDLIARSKGFLVPDETQTEEAQKETPLGALGNVIPGEDDESILGRKGVAPTLKPEERQAKIEELTAHYSSVGIDPDDAARMAKSKIEAIYGKLAEEVPTDVAPADRVEQLTQDFIAAGEDPANARALAEKQVADETEADAIAETTAKGEKGVGTIIPPRRGVGSAMAGQPGAITATQGAGAPVTDGMVPAGQNVADVTEGKGEQPGALSDKEKIFNLQRTQPEAKPGDAIRLNLPWVPGGYEVSGIVGDAVYLDNDGREVAADAPGAKRYVPVTYKVDGQQITNPFDPETLRLNTVAFEQKPDLTAAKPAIVSEDAEADAAAETMANAVTQAVTETKKRGRKPQVLTEEQKTQKTAATKEYKRKYTKGTRDFARASQGFAEATAPLDEGEFESEAELANALNERRANLAAAVRELLSIEQNYRGTALGNRAKELLGDRSKLSQKDYDDIKKGWQLTKPSASLASSRVKPNPFMKGTMSAQAALNHIGKTGTPFERMLANRIRKYLTGVTVYVVEDTDPTPARMAMAVNAEAWDRARGVYMAADDTGPREVYLRGASFGYQNGVNNVTILHELLHAALNHRVSAGLLASFYGKPDAQLARLVTELNNLMEVAANRYLQLERAGRLPPRLQSIVEATASEDPDTGEIDYDIFTLPQEFLSYGLSDPDVQQFLMNIEGRRTDETAFSRFVSSILKFLGLAPSQFTALSDLIGVTDDILGAHTADLVQPAKARPFLAAKQPLSPEAAAAAKAQLKVERAVKEANAKYGASKQAEEYAKGVTVAQAVQNPLNLIPLLKDLYSRASVNTRRQMVKALPTETLAAWAGQDVPELKNTDQLLQKMNGMMLQLLKSAGQLTTEMDRTFRKDPSLREKLNQITTVSTLSEVDPSDPKTKKRSVQLDRMYADLGPEGQRLYKLIKNHYEALSDYFGRLLDDQITRSGLPIAEQANLLKKIRVMYETGSKITPYFPLVRRGDYWLGVGSNPRTRLFTMFETVAERDRAMESLIDERVKQKIGESDADYKKRREERKAELLEDETFTHGNDINSLREYTTQSSSLLKGMFAAIDASSLTDPEAKDKLKDDIYQLYLQTMPEQSFRRQFIHRQGIAGFRTDLLRNVADTTSKMAVQLSRIKYAPQLRNSISQARDSILNRPNLEPFVEEMKQRVLASLNPGKESTAAKVAGALNKLGFIFYLGGASSALLQPLSVFQTGMPILSRYGVVNANREMMRMLKVWSTVGSYKTGPNGGRTWSIEYSKEYTPEERQAIREMLSRDVTTSTYASAVFDYKNVPSDKATDGPIMAFTKGTVDVLVLGGLMHSTERLTREMMFMASFRLNRQAGKPYADAIDQAVFDTNEAFGNYGEYNRPLFMKGVAGKVMTQFMMYPLHVTLYLLRNFKEMIKPMDGRTRGEAMKKFFGTLGATFILGGYVALPMFSVVMGFLGGAWEALKGKDLPEDLRSLSFEMWFRTRFMPEMLGEMRVAGRKASDLLERGVLNSITGADFSSRVSLNNMWIREKKEAKDIHSAAAEYALGMAGPAPNALLSIAEGAMAAIEGDYKKFLQKTSPAGFRNFVNAYTFYKEGAKDNKGAQILSRDAFTTGELLFQAVGFRQDLLSNTQYINFKVIGIDQKIQNERTKITEKLDRTFREKDFKGFNNALKKDVAEFNRKYPSYALTEDNIYESVTSKAERRAESQRGVTITEKNAPWAIAAIQESRKAARQKEAAGKPAP